MTSVRQLLAGAAAAVAVAAFGWAAAHVFSDAPHAPMISHTTTAR